MHLAKDRSAYGLLAVVFVLSRLAYCVAGVRFDARPLLHCYQFIDPELLKHRLIESMYYLHVQPPGRNLYAGAVLKLFPQSYPIALHIVHLLLGMATCLKTSCCMNTLCVIC